MKTYEIKATHINEEDVIYRGMKAYIQDYIVKAETPSEAEQIVCGYAPYTNIISIKEVIK